LLVRERIVEVVIAGTVEAAVAAEWHRDSCETVSKC
tara:strand:+ start:772 stop:879 length:108 start_codon:yes stop_codon:yes gene_type:complete